jgi:phosphotransferase system, enzyme I, PtsP
MMMKQTSRPRLLLKRLHKVMASPGEGGQARLNQVVRAIAHNMVAEVCSVYLVRSDNILELFAAFGLKQEAVHKSNLKMGEGVVGLIAREGIPLNLAEAADHPNFMFLPETGEEMYHSLLGVPIIRGGKTVGVIVIQNIKARHYNEEEVEALQTVAMVLAELLTGGDLVRPEELAAPGASNDHAVTIEGQKFAEGLAAGAAVFHEPKVDILNTIAENVDSELKRLKEGLETMQGHIEHMVSSADWDDEGTTFEILETYKMFAYDQGWQDKILEAIESGLTAEAAVERIQQDLHGRMTHAQDPYLKERLADLEDLSHRLIRVLLGYYGKDAHHKLKKNSIIIARTMGPAELLEYDRRYLKGIVLEEGSPTSHVTIIAKALNIPLLGRAVNILLEAQEHDPVIVDAVAGRVIIRPRDDITKTYGKSLKERRKLLARYAAERRLPARTRDGAEISLQLNAGLMIDMANLEATGADAIGLFRTEFQFMVSATMPRMEAQTKLYSNVLKAAGKKPVIFRTLDIGGDKKVAFLPHMDEENPAMGWRAIRQGLDRVGLLRYQLRALVKACAGKDLNIMFPMIASIGEFRQARAVAEQEVARLKKTGKAKPRKFNIGCMLEIPSLAWDIDNLLKYTDFVSIGTNDLMQFFFASDRSNPKLTDRYEVLSPLVLGFLNRILQACDKARVPVTVCGEMGGTPIEAMALIGLGFRRLSVSASAIGPVKMMLRSLDLGDLKQVLKAALAEGDNSIRVMLEEYARSKGIPV